MDNKESIDQVISRVLDRNHSPADLGELIKRFSAGHDINELKKLLSGSEAVIADGVYILSEIGLCGWPLVERAAGLLSHDSATIRFFAIACILAHQTRASDQALAKVLKCMGDEADRVRWRAIDFAIECSLSTLEKCENIFEETKDKNNSLGVRWLLRQTCENLSEIEASIGDEDALMRGYSIAALRRAKVIESKIVEKALHSTDPVIVSFARHI